MTVTTALPVTGVIRNQGDQSVKLSAVLNNRGIDKVATDTSNNVSQSAQVVAQAQEQYPPLNLRVDALSVAVAGSQTDSIDSSAQQVSRLLDQLLSLATRASLGGLSESALELLNGQFQALRLAVSNVPPSPPQALPVTELLSNIPGGLDSALGKEAAAGNLVVGGLNNDKTLLGDANVATVDAANAAIVTIANAQQTVDAQRVLLARVKDEVEFASVSADGALANQEALRSTLSEADLDGTTSGQSLIATLQAQADAARAVQTSRLPANVLNLIS